MNPIIEAKIFEWALAYVENETCIPEIPDQKLRPEEVAAYAVLKAHEKFIESREGY